MRKLLLASLTLALAGCQAGRPYAAPGFALGRHEAVPVVAAALPLAGGPQATGDASLTVDVRTALPAARRLMATLADVAKVAVRVQGAGVDQTLELSKAQLDAGTTSVTFAGLPAGPYTVTVRALDASNALLGSDVRQATVTAGQTTTVQASVKLSPTIANPRVLPSPTAGTSGGGGSGPTTGGLTAQVTLRDDVPVYTPPILGAYAGVGTSSASWAQITTDAEGHAWTTWGNNGVARISPTGQVAVQTPPGPVNALERSADGTRIFLGSTAAMSTTLTGTFGPAVTGVPIDGMNAIYDILAPAPDGTLYAGGYWMDLRQIRPDGTARIFLPRHVESFAVDAANDVWVAEFLPPAGAAAPTGVTVTKYAPDGSVRLSRTLPYDGPALSGGTTYFDLDLALDGAGNVWVTLPKVARLVRLEPDGEVLDTKPYPGGRLYADPLGRMWAVGLDKIGRLDAAGELTAWYAIGQVNAPPQIAITADDHLWVGLWQYGVLHLDLDP